MTIFLFFHRGQFFVDILFLACYTIINHGVIAVKGTEKMKNKPYYELKTDKAMRVEELFLFYSMPPHFHRAVELQYVIKKSYTVMIHDQPVTAKKDEILLITSQTVHYAEKQEDTKTIMVLVPYDFFTYLPVFQREYDSYFILDDKEFNKKVILPILRLLVKNFDRRIENEPPFTNQLSSGWTNIIYGELFDHYTFNFGNKQSANSNFFDNILNYVDQNYSAPELSLQSISKTFGYNPSYLSRSFKKGFAVSLSQHIRSVRVKKFLNLYPHQTNANILNLALQCGFSSLAAFYRAFHDVTNLAPKEYFRQEKKEREEEIKQDEKSLPHDGNDEKTLPVASLKKE